MSASDHTGPQFIHLLGENDEKYQFKALYHGTLAELNEGDIIDPAKSALNTRRLAFATPSLSAAKRFAGYSRKPVPRVPTTEDGKVVHDESLGFVYQVEPLDTEDSNSTWVRKMKYFSPPTHEVPSNKGFRVIRKVYPK